MTSPSTVTLALRRGAICAPSWTTISVSTALTSLPASISNPSRVTERLTGDPFAAMWWTLEDYADNVVCGYGYQLIGWPGGVTFTNLSKVTGGTATLRRLQELWDDKVLKFVPVTEAERRIAVNHPDWFAPARQCAHRRKTTAPRNHTGTFVRPRRRRGDGKPKLGPKTPAYVVEGLEDPEDPIVD